MGVPSGLGAVCRVERESIGGRADRRLPFRPRRARDSRLAIARRVSDQGFLLAADVSTTVPPIIHNTIGRSDSREPSLNASSPRFIAPGARATGFTCVSWNHGT